MQNWLSSGTPDLFDYLFDNWYKEKTDQLSKKLKTERFRRVIKDFYDLVYVEEINMLQLMPLLFPLLAFKRAVLLLGL